LVVVCNGILALACGFHSPAADAASAKETWVLQQVHHISGSYTIILMPDAMKVMSKRSGFVGIARAPLWKVCLYNPRKKLMYETTMSNWAKYGAFPAFVSDNEFKMGISMPPAHTGIIICGLHCRSYQVTHKSRPSGTTSLSSFGRQAKILGDTFRQFYVTNDIAYTRERGQFLSGIFKNLIIDAIEVRQTAGFANGQTQIELDTISCKHQSVPESEMQYPASGLYRKSNVPQDVAEDEGERMGLQELFDGVSQFGDIAPAQKK